MDYITRHRQEINERLSVLAEDVLHRAAAVYGTSAPLGTRCRLEHWNRVFYGKLV